MVGGSVTLRLFSIHMPVLFMLFMLGVGEAGNPATFPVVDDSARVLVVVESSRANGRKIAMQNVFHRHFLTGVRQ